MGGLSLPRLFQWSLNWILLCPSWISSFIHPIVFSQQLKPLKDQVRAYSGLFVPHLRYHSVCCSFYLTHNGHLCHFCIRTCYCCSAPRVLLLLRLHGVILCLLSFFAHLSEAYSDQFLRWLPDTPLPTLQ